MAIAEPCNRPLVKVLDIHYPTGIQVRHLAKLKEQGLHLGYQFNGCFTGEWVGYAEPGGRAVPINSRQLQAMIGLAGLVQLPPAPSYWASPENHRIGMMWLILGLCAVIAAVLRQMGVLARKPDDGLETTVQALLPQPPTAALVSAAGASVPASYRSALVAVDRAASEHSRVSVTKLEPISVGQDSGPRQARFGRR